MSDDDLFGDNRDEFFTDDEEFGGEEFEEFEGFEEFDLGEAVDVPDFGAEAPVEEGAAEPTIFGLNRTFAIIGAVVALVVCLGIAGLVVVIFANRGPSPVEQTVAAVYATNTQVAVYLAATETQNAENLNLTATATLWTPTPTPSETPTPTPSPTEELATPTPFFQIVTPTPGEGVGGGLTGEVVAQTATALAGILAGGLASPTPEEAIGLGGTPALIVTPTPVSALPTTGLFDEIGQGGGVNTLATAGLAILGLAAIIIVARRLRTG